MRDRVIVALDFEASSLSETGYPIEVAFAFYDGLRVTKKFATLIKPRPNWQAWRHWSAASEKVHGITLAALDEGMDADAVCQRLDGALQGRKVLVDGGTFDAFWLARLYDGKSPAFELDHLDGVSPPAFGALKRGAQVAHRALPDAIWLAEAVAGLRLPNTG